MALTHWTFLFAAPGLPETGEIREVTSPASTTVLAGFPTTATAIGACLQHGLHGAVERTELIELCGAFDYDDLRPLREAYPDIPIGLVTYAGSMTTGLHQLFG